MDEQERLRQQLDRAQEEVRRTQEEIDKEFDQMKRVDEDREELRHFIRRMSKGERG